jgi:hypothetical protein
MPARTPASSQRIRHICGPATLKHCIFKLDERKERRVGETDFASH